jgi:hypothetical protein
MGGGALVPAVKDPAVKRLLGTNVATDEVMQDEVMLGAIPPPIKFESAAIEWQ